MTAPAARAVLRIRMTSPAPEVIISFRILEESPMSLPGLNSHEEFQKAVDSGDPFLVKFTAEW